MSGKSKRRLAAIMFTDMVGYTALMQEDESLARVWRQRHRDVQKSSTEKFNGHILQYFGDGTLIIFDSAVDAVEAAVDIQENLRKEPKVPLRIGIHTGDVVVEEDGIFGDGVNLAARIESLCKPGGVFFSGKVHDEIKNQHELKNIYLGPFELKNVKQPVDIYAISDDRVVIPELKEVQANRADKVHSIAVLPFVNMSHDAENEYFSDGISEEILNALTRINGLRVTSRTSSFAFKNSKEDIRSIGKTLNVGTILEGSVRRAGNRVRITAQLIKTNDGYHYWSETYDRELSDIFAVQDEISQKIAQKLESDFGRNEAAEKPKEIKNVDAYKSYLKGMHHFYKFNPEEIKKGIEHFNESLKLDPDYAPSMAGLANSLTYLGAIGQRKPSEVFPVAEKLAYQAIEINPDNALSYVAIGAVNLLYKWNLVQAKSYLEKAIEVNPSSAEPHSYLGWYYLLTENYTKHLEYHQKASDLDPLSVQVNINLAQAYFVYKDYDKAIAQYNKVLELEPSARGAYEGLGWIEMANDRIDSAIEYFEKYRSFITDPLKGWTAIGYAYAKSGQIDKAEEALEKIKQRQEKENVSLYIDIAILYAGLGKLDEAFESMHRALKERLGGIVFIKTNPMWDFIRRDDRFSKILNEFHQSVIE